MRDQKDRSPLRHAMKNDHVRVAAYPLDSGARVEADLLDWMDRHKEQLSGCKKM